MTVPWEVWADMVGVSWLGSMGISISVGLMSVSVGVGVSVVLALARGDGTREEEVGLAIRGLLERWLSELGQRMRIMR